MKTLIDYLNEDEKLKKLIERNIQKKIEFSEKKKNQALETVRKEQQELNRLEDILKSF